MLVGGTEPNVIPSVLGALKLRSGGVILARVVVNIQHHLSFITYSALKDANALIAGRGIKLWISRRREFL